jgi:hypothetical protein
MPKFQCWLKKEWFPWWLWGFWLCCPEWAQGILLLFSLLNWSGYRHTSHKSLQVPGWGGGSAGVGEAGRGVVCFPDISRYSEHMTILYRPSILFFMLFLIIVVHCTL